MPTTSSQGRELREFIDAAPIAPLQWRLLILCAVCLMLDGFDVQSIGYVAPAIVQQWHIEPAALGAVFSAGLFGMVVGAGGFSLAADRIGRRPAIIAATLLSGIAMAATSRVADVDQLLAMRFISGLGFGALMPNALALTAEYCPSRVRTALVMVMGGGFTLGAALGGWLTSLVLASWGWRTVFLLGGIGPIAVAVAMIAFLPESLRLMILRGAPKQKVLHLLGQIDPAAARDAPDLRGEEMVGKASPVELFKDGRATTTILLWIVDFMSLIDLYFLSNWLPTLLRSANYSLQTAVLSSTLLQAAGFVGTLVMALLVRRTDLRLMLVAAFGIAALSVLLIGQSAHLLPVLMSMVAISGFCVIGGTPALNAFAADYYPTFIRSTGVGWMLGVGRFGSILGPLVGGLILQMKLGYGVLFLAAAVPAAIASLAIWLVGKQKSARPDESLTARAST